MNDQNGKWRPGPGEIRVLVGRGEARIWAEVVDDHDPLGVTHPADAAAEVAGIRRFAKLCNRGLVFYTYSPITLNHLRPEEAVIVYGTNTPICRQMSEIPNIDRLLTGFTLGELWLAHADDEASLFDGVADV